MRPTPFTMTVFVLVWIAALGGLIAGLNALLGA